jgi:hypothetical protein
MVFMIAFLPGVILREQERAERLAKVPHEEKDESRRGR